MPLDVDSIILRLEMFRSDPVNYNDPLGLVLQTIDTLRFQREQQVQDRARIKELINRLKEREDLSEDKVTVIRPAASWTLTQLHAVGLTMRKSSHIARMGSFYRNVYFAPTLVPDLDACSHEGSAVMVTDQYHPNKHSMDFIKPVKQKCSATKPVTETSKTRGLVDRYSISSNSQESTDRHLLESPLPSTRFASRNAGSEERSQEQTAASIPAYFEQATNTVSQREQASIELARKREDLMRWIGWDGTFVYPGGNPWVFCHPDRMLEPDEAGEDEDENEVTFILGDEYEDCASPHQYLEAWAPGRPRARKEKRRTYGKLQATSSTSVLFDNLLGEATRHLVSRAVYKAGSSRNAITYSLHREEIQQSVVPSSPLLRMHSHSPIISSECYPVFLTSQHSTWLATATEISSYQV